MKIIRLTQGWVAWVDDCDYERLNAHKWYAKRMKRHWYAARSLPTADGKQKTILMHREVLNAQPGREVDHILGESSPGIIHNWRDNLRLCTHAQNQQGFQRRKEGTTSLYRGVWWNKTRRKWQVGITVDGHLLHLGLFVSEEGAARAYDVAALKHFGEFASLNFP